MIMPARLALALLACVLGCGDDGGASTTDGTASTTAATATGTASSSTGTTEASTTAGAGTGSSSGATEASTGEATGSGTGTSGTTAESTTGVDVSGFERFLVRNTAGPCAPGADCDGFVELLAGGTLRVEAFGDVENDVVVVQISAEDYAAAAQVFADPALIGLLDGPEPLCDPPTDIWESMLVALDGVEHEATTTTCAQPPIAAAREMAKALQAEYAP